jgi:uncharacterized Fe-S cluster-containing MiaB family protein
MQKPVPGLSDAEAVADIHDAINYLSHIADKHDIHINMHLNPTYVAAGTALATAFREGRYTPPLLEDVAEAAYHARAKSVSTFIGLSDEGLAVEGGSFLLENSQVLVDKLELFNRSRNFNILEEICKNRKIGL